MLRMNNLTIKTEDERIVQNVSLQLFRGDWYALVGESGSGKSITASAIGGLLPGNLQVDYGEIYFKKHDLLYMKKREKSLLLGNDIAYIFQDYTGAFTPFLRIGKQMDEVLRTHTQLLRTERKRKALDALQSVKLEEMIYSSYPCQLSGGQLQRAAIAFAMMLNPSLLIADEPTTALDSITAHHILQLILKLTSDANCAVLFITHDLRLVKKYATKIGVMEKGRIVETGKKNEVLEDPQHPYTKMLLKAIPKLLDTRARLCVGMEDHHEE